MKKLILILFVTIVCAGFVNAQKAEKFNLKKVNSMKVSKQFLEAIKTNALLKKVFKAKKTGVNPNADYAIYKVVGTNSYVITRSKVKPDIIKAKIQAMGTVQIYGANYTQIIECKCFNSKQPDDCDFRKDSNGNTVCNSGGKCSDCRTEEHFYDTLGQEVPRSSVN